MNVKGERPTERNSNERKTKVCKKERKKEK